MPMQTELLDLNKEGKLNLEPKTIIDSQCSLSLWYRTIMEYLIKWKNTPLEEATWVDLKINEMVVSENIGWERNEPISIDFFYYE